MITLRAMSSVEQGLLGRRAEESVAILGGGERKAPDMTLYCAVTYKSPSQDNETFQH